MRRPSLLLPLLFATACFGGREPRDEVCEEIAALANQPSILAIGDSVFAWRQQTCRTIPDIVALELDRRVEHAAVNGARVTGGDHPIVGQYRPGAWEWVLVDGGGNDLNNECECGVDCDPVLDELLNEEGTRGQLAGLVERILDDGARVLLYGYYEVPETANYGFDECIAEIDELRERQERLAARHDRVTFVDGRDVVTVEGTPEAYAFDDVHPSKEGARLVGELIAKRIEETERE